MKLKLTDSFQDIIIKMSEGNPGAINFLMKLYQHDRLKFTDCVLTLDKYEIYGDKIYKLWNDCNNNDIVKTIINIDYVRVGVITNKQLHDNLNQGRATKFEIMEG